MDIHMAANWNDMRYLLALNREGSALKAAEVLGVSHQTVARRLAALEKSLGAALVDRSGQNWRLSRVGQGITRQADEMEAAMCTAALSARTGPQGLSGRVRITSADAGFEWFVLPQIAALGALYPGIEFDLISDNAPLDLGSGQFDIAVRFMMSPPRHLVGRNGGPVEFALFGAPETIGLLDKATKDGVRVKIPFVALVNRHMRSREWLPESVDSTGTITNVSDLSTLIRAVQYGLGAGYLPLVVGRELKGMKESKSLERHHPFDVFVLTNAEARQSERVRLVAGRLHKFIAQKLRRSG